MYKEGSKALIIHHEPVHSLSDCVRLLSAEQLKTIAVHSRLSGDELDAVSADSVASQVQSQVRALYDCVPRELVISAFKVLTKDCGMSLPLSESVKKEIDAVGDETLSDTLFLQSRGIIFLFAHEGKVTSVLPDETLGFFSQLISSDSDLTKAGEWSEFHKYAVTLTKLYGICPMTVLLEIWNRDHSEKQIADKAECKCLVQECLCVTTHFNLIGGALVSPEIDNGIICEEIKEKRKKSFAYIPSAEEIKSHFRCYDYDEETEAFKAMKAFLMQETKNAKQAEKITYEVCTLIKAGVDFMEIPTFLQKEHGVRLKKDTGTKFISIFAVLIAQCHLWIRWGQTGMDGLTSRINSAKDELARRRE